MGLDTNSNTGSGNGETPDIRRFAGIDTPMTEAEFVEAMPGDAGDAAVRAAKVRAAADAELADAIDNADREIAFERHLRDATASAMGSLSTPAALRARIEAMAAESAGSHAAEQDAFADAIEARAGATRSPSFWTGSAGRIVGTLAAALLLGVVGVFAWSLGAASTANQPIAARNAAYRTDLARFVAGEHTRSLDESYSERKMTYKAPADAADAIGSDLDHVPVIPPCGGATKFGGASPCGVPGKGPSAHMQFILPAHDDNGQVIDGAQGGKVSIFVKQDQGELEIAEGTTYLVDTAACNVTDAYICVWRRGGLLYTLVSEDRNAPVCTKFLAQFGVDPPDPANSL